VERREYFCYNNGWWVCDELPRKKRSFQMKVIKGYYNGKDIVFSGDLGEKPGEVIVVFEDGNEDLTNLSQEAFAKVWDNDEDAAYDEL
jgi:hypothetical protein